MTRTELFQICEKEFYKSKRQHRLNTMQAVFVNLFTHDLGEVYILKSYDTVVAVFLVDLDLLIIRDRYSNTTQKHCSTFDKEFAISNVLYCYDRSDKIRYKTYNRQYTINELKTDDDFESTLEDIFANRI